MSSLIKQYTFNISGVNSKEVEKNILDTAAKASAIVSIPIPILNIAGVVYVQVRMINKIAEDFGVRQDSGYTRTIISAIASTVLVELVSEAVESLVATTKLESVLGEAFIKAAVAGFLTSMIGEVYVRHFAKGGDETNIDISAFSSYLNEYVKLEEMNISNLASRLMNSTLEKAGI